MNNHSLHTENANPELYSFAFKYYFDYFKGYCYPYVKFGILPFTLEGGVGLTFKLYKNIYLNSSYHYIENSVKMNIYAPSCSTNVFLVSLGYNLNFLP